MHGDFTWIDLSTFDLTEAKKFYGSVFRWSFTGDESSYINCAASTVPCSGLYEMPEFFQNIRMPSFWMTYISVSDINSVVKKAQALGGKVELEETNALGRIALIRDPAGAGFTCYEGDSKSSVARTPEHGRWYWSELFISDFSKVEKFYTELFSWSFEEDITSDRYFIRNERAERIGAVQVASNEIKGEKEFWGVFFGVRDADGSVSKIIDAGGEMIYELSNSTGEHYLVRDSQGAAFFLSGQDRTGAKQPSGAEQLRGRKHLKWRSLLGLVAIYLAVFFEADWIWGLLFLFWVIPDLRTGTTHFIEPLTRRFEPVLYWAVVLTWIALSIYLLLAAIK